MTYFLVKLSHAETTLKFTQVTENPSQTIGVEILKAAYSKLDISIEILIFPGKRALKESSEGRADGEVFRIIEIADEYPTLIRVPTPIHTVESSVFSIRHNIEITDCFALRNYTIGIVRGIKHAELCTQGMNSIQVYPYSSTMFELLAKHKIDMLISSKVNGILMAKKMNLTSIKLFSPPLNRFNVYHYLHTKNKDLVPKINKVLLEMTNSGELEKIEKSTIEKIFNTSAP